MISSRGDFERLEYLFNEATLVGAELDETARVAAVTLELLLLPEVGPWEGERRVQVKLLNVGRCVASLRRGAWNAFFARRIRFPPSELLEVVRSFGGGAIYGNQFFDQAWRDLRTIHWRYSFDVRLAGGSKAHSISLFQEGNVRHLDLIFWFEALELLFPDYSAASLDSLCEGNDRWWRAMRAGDPRVAASGIVALKA